MHSAVVIFPPSYQISNQNRGEQKAWLEQRRARLEAVLSVLRSGPQRMQQALNHNDLITAKYEPIFYCRTFKILSLRLLRKARLVKQHTNRTWCLHCLCIHRYSCAVQHLASSELETHICTCMAHLPYCVVLLANVLVGREAPSHDF